MRALIASGSGRYADPWHPYPRTSARLAEVLAGAGFVVDVDDEVDHALTRLAGYDLLVVNAGDPWRSDEAADRPSEDAVRGLAEAIDGGIGMLGMHSSVSSLRDYPRWAEAIGAVWIPGASHHPPADRTGIRIDAAVADEIGDFELFDERYCDLQFVGHSRVVARHERDGTWLPTAWTRELGAARIACDLLGHDERSYDSEGHRALITWLARWAAGAERGTARTDRS